MTDFVKSLGTSTTAVFPFKAVSLAGFNTVLKDISLLSSLLNIFKTCCHKYKGSRDIKKPPRECEENIISPIK